MVAAMHESHLSTQWRGLEPSGLGHDLLVEWAPWVREDNEGGHSWHVKPRVDPGYHGDPPHRVNMTDKIVSRIRMEHRPYYSVISRYYLDQLQPWQMVEMLRQTEGWIRSMLLASCGLVELRFNELESQPARRDRARPYETRSG